MQPALGQEHDGPSPNLLTTLERMMKLDHRMRPTALELHQQFASLPEKSPLKARDCCGQPAELYVAYEPKKDITSPSQKGPSRAGDRIWRCSRCVCSIELKRDSPLGQNCLRRVSQLDMFACTCNAILHEGFILSSELFLPTDYPWNVVAS